MIRTLKETETVVSKFVLVGANTVSRNKIRLHSDLIRRGMRLRLLFSTLMKIGKGQPRYL